MWNHLDLFSGIGGFSLAAQRVWGEEHNIVAFVEQDKYCQQILNKHWPDVPIFDDIKEYKYDAKEEIDLLTAGVPCQPSSVAGKRRGSADHRWLWPHAHRIIEEAKPRWIIFENPNGFLTVNNGLEFEITMVNLEKEGYETQAYIIPACSIDAPHQRYRIFILAYSGHIMQFTNEISRSNEQTSIGAPERQNGTVESKGSSICKGRIEILANANPERSQRWNCQSLSERVSKLSTRPCGTQPANGDYWLPEPNVGRVANGISNRVDRVKALGNAIVPQVVMPIMQAIKEIDLESYDSIQY